MKIAFLTPEYPLPIFGNSGGIGTSIHALCKGLLNKGDSPIVIIYGRPIDEVVECDGITFYCIKNVKVKGLSWWLTRKKIEIKINELFEKGSIDLVEAPDWTGITSFIQPKKCPVVIRLNGSDTYFCHLDNRPVKFWNKFHEKRALKKADGHISVSQYTADVTNELFGLKIPFTIIPNGITVQNFEPITGVHSSENIILYFGTLIRKKGLLELPLIFNEVVNTFPNVKLLLVGRDSADKITGNPSTWNLMQQLFTVQAMSKVNYLGGVPYNEVKTYIERATVCVFPSFAEALPVSWLEAMVMKKAIVASNIGWATEVIENECEGFLVDPINHQEYADKIIKLISNKDINLKFSEQAYQKVCQSFDVEVLNDKNLDFYKKMIVKCN